MSTIPENTVEVAVTPKPKGRSQHVGLAGEHYVVYSLLVRGYHASIIGGDVPNIDVLVSSADGSRQLSLQIKTARWARPPGLRWGYEVLEWDVSSSALALDTPNCWYAFVDLQHGEGWSPIVYLVPSLWVAKWVRRRPDDRRHRYPLKSSAHHLCKERWDYIEKFFKDDQSVLQLTKTVPKEATWGK